MSEHDRPAALPGGGQTPNYIDALLERHGLARNWPKKTAKAYELMCDVYYGEKPGWSIRNFFRIRKARLLDPEMVRSMAPWTAKR